MSGPARPPRVLSQSMKRALLVAALFLAPVLGACGDIQTAAQPAPALPAPVQPTLTVSGPGASGAYLVLTDVTGAVRNNWYDLEPGTYTLTVSKPRTTTYRVEVVITADQKATLVVPQQAPAILDPNTGALSFDYSPVGFTIIVLNAAGEFQLDATRLPPGEYRLVAYKRGVEYKIFTATALKGVSSPVAIDLSSPGTPSAGGGGSSGYCWVNGYYRRDGTWVNGYWRRC